MFKFLNLCILTLCLMVFLVFSVTAEEFTPSVNQEFSEFDVKKWLKEEQLCLPFLGNEKILSNQYEDAKNCYLSSIQKSSVFFQSNKIEYEEVLYRLSVLEGFLIKRILTLDYSTEVFTEFLEEILYRARFTNLIKFLIGKGASTKGIVASQVSDGSIVVCESRDYIVDQNKDLYTPDNISENDALKELLQLVDTSTGHYAICSKSVEIIISQYPDLLNAGGTFPTPLHLFLRDTISAGASLELAPKLMTEQNILILDEDGNSAIHYFLLFNIYKDLKYFINFQVVLDKFVSLGGDLDSPNNDGQTINGLLAIYETCGGKEMEEYTDCKDVAILRSKTTNTN